MAPLLLDLHFFFPLTIQADIVRMYCSPKCIGTTKSMHALSYVPAHSEIGASWLEMYFSIGWVLTNIRVANIHGKGGGLADIRVCD